MGWGGWRAYQVPSTKYFFSPGTVTEIFIIEILAECVKIRGVLLLKTM